jgi:hypothetical protein
MWLVYLIVLEGLQTSGDCSMGNLSSAGNVGNRDVVGAEFENYLIHLFVGLGVWVACGHAVAEEAGLGS